jgi:hypothetical protein
MAYINKYLSKFAKAGGKFIKLDEGDSFKGVFLTVTEEYSEKFKKNNPVYKFRDSNGQEKILSSSSARLADKMMTVIPGSLISMTRLGVGSKTDYSVKVIKEPKMPLNVEDEEDDEDEEEIPEVFKPTKKSKKVEEDEEDEEEEDEEEEAPKKKKSKKVEEEEDEPEDDEDSDLFN